MPVCSYNKPIDYFLVYCGYLCTGTNGVTPVDFCCETAVLQILQCLVKTGLCIVCVFHWCHRQSVLSLVCLLFFKKKPTTKQNVVSEGLQILLV